MTMPTAHELALLLIVANALGICAVRIELCMREARYQDTRYTR